MKQVKLLIFAIVWLGVASQLRAQEFNLHLDLYQLVEAECKSVDAQMSLEGYESVHTSNYDIKYHRMVWALDPDTSFIKGAVTTYFVPLDSDFHTIGFDLSHDLLVEAAIYNGQSVAFEQDSNETLHIKLPNVLPIGQLDSVTVIYQGNPPNNGFGAFIKTEHDSVPIIWTLSEPFGARDWWPCKQSLNDKIDSIDVIVTTPSQYRVASNGLLVNEVSLGMHKVYHWKHNYPIAAYLVAVAVTNYATYSDYFPNGGDTVEILNYVFPEDLDTSKAQTGATVPMMQLFSNLFGEYPFAEEKYGHAQFGWGGGMEHQTMSFMQNFGWGLVAHELAHQWFGNKVTCGSWNDIWLNEGFATYLTALTYEAYAPNVWPQWKVAVNDYVTSQPGGSVYVPDISDINRIFNGRLTYYKGSFVLHMLRWKLGDANFFGALNNYINDGNLAYAYAKSGDLQKHLEDESGVDLDEFFKDWLYGEGHPVYHVNWHQIDDSVSVTIHQNSSNASVDFFEMPVPIAFRGDSSLGEDTIVVFDHTFSGENFKFKLPFKASEVVFDPEYWILTPRDSVVTVIESQYKDFGLVFGPNPVKDQLNISVIGKNISVKKVEILDIVGKLHRQELGITSKKVTIDTANLPEGVYIVNVETSKGRLSGKIIKDNN